MVVYIFVLQALTPLTGNDAAERQQELRFVGAVFRRRRRRRVFERLDVRVDRAADDAQKLVRLRLMTKHTNKLVRLRLMTKQTNTQTRPSSTDDDETNKQTPQQKLCNNS